MEWSTVGSWNDNRHLDSRLPFLKTATAYAGATGQIDLIRLCIEDKSHDFVKEEREEKCAGKVVQIWPGLFLVWFSLSPRCHP